MKNILILICVGILGWGFLFTILAQEDSNLVPEEASDPLPLSETTESACNENGVCDAGETYQNCPEECIDQDFTADGGIPPFDGK